MCVRFTSSARVSVREREQACRGIQELRHDTVDSDRRRRRPRDTLFLLSQMETNVHTSTRDLALSHTDCASTATHTHKECPNGHERRTHDRTGSAASPPPSAGLRSPASSHTYTLTRSAQGVGWNVAVERAHATHVRAVSVFPITTHARAAGGAARAALSPVPRRVHVLEFDIFQTPLLRRRLLQADSRSRIELFVRCVSSRLRLVDPGCAAPATPSRSVGVVDGVVEGGVETAARLKWVESSASSPAPSPSRC